MEPATAAASLGPTALAPESDGQDKVLRYISRILMEEDMDDDFFYRYPDHPALLHAQQPFSDILSHTPPTSMKPAPTAAAAAAAKLMAEPDGEGGRATKLMAMDEPEEDGAAEMFVGLMLDCCNQWAKAMGDLRLRLAMEKAAAVAVQARGRLQRMAAEVVDLRALLMTAAQAVATDRERAGDLLRQIRKHASPAGDAAQRLAHYFAEGLEARLAGTGSQLYRSLAARRTSAVEFLRAQELFFAACAFHKMGIVFSNIAAIQAVEGRTRLHIVDYGVGYGLHWPGLLRWLETRPGGPPEVRMTAIDLPQPGFRPAQRIEQTGRRLADWARRFDLPFQFRAIAGKWESVRAEDLGLDPGEVLVVNDLFGFSTLMDEGVNGGEERSARDAVLGAIREMRPDVFVHGVVNGSSGPFFLARFREAVFFYSAVFDMLDATTPRDSRGRETLERDVYARSALNAVACEGADRVERPEAYRRWEMRNRRAGLRQLPLKPIVVKVVRDTVKELYHREFVVGEDGGWLLQGWKGRILYAHSTWVADDGLNY